MERKPDCDGWRVVTVTITFVRTGYSGWATFIGESWAVAATT